MQVLERCVTNMCVIDPVYTVPDPRGHDIILDSF